MKAATGSLVGNFLTPLSPQDPSGQRLAAQERHAGNFTAHLHSAVAKGQHAKPSSRAKADIPIDSAKEVSRRSFTTTGASAKGAKHAEPTDPCKRERPPVFALRISEPHDRQPKAEAAAVSDFAGSAAPTEAEEEDPLPVSEMPQTTPPNQVVLVASLVISAPPVIQLPTNPQIATGEVTLAPADSPEQPIETLKPASSPKREVVEEQKVSASVLEPEAQVNPNQERATLAGDPGESRQGESQKHLREDQPRLGALTSLPADSAEQINGTAVAKQMLLMTNTVEMAESAGPAVKNLPGAERGLEDPLACAISHVESAREVRHDLQVDAAVSLFSATSALSGGTKTATSDVPTVERVVHAVMEGVVHLRHTGSESVTVVLKPDGGTELFLKVEMRDGTLSAQLHFERGDRGAFDPHFDELQRRLAEQGVRLSRAEDASMGGNAQFAQSQRRSLVPDDDSKANAASSVTKIISNNQTMTRQNPRGFETWA